LNIAALFYVKAFNFFTFWTSLMCNKCAVEKAKELDSKVYVVKAQIHAGGRGKAGGVKIAKNNSLA
jgi:succinyl-CoA synthetase beta subunit